MKDELNLHTTKVFRKNKDAFESGSPLIINQGGTSCLTGDTLVKTINGHVPIKELKVGEFVYSLSKDGKIVLNRIVDKFRYEAVPPNEKMIIFTSKKFKIRCTYDHKFRVNGRWVKAIDIAGRILEDNGQSLCDIHNGEVGHVSQTQGKYKSFAECGINEAGSISRWVFKDGCMGENNTHSHFGGKCVSAESKQFAAGEPQEWEQARQQGGEFGVGDNIAECETRIRYRIDPTQNRGEKRHGKNNECTGREDKENIQAPGLQQTRIPKQGGYNDSHFERHVTWSDLVAYPLDVTIQDRTETVYDIEVENDHNYLITSENIVCHNSGKTYAILQLLIYIAGRSSKSLVISIVSETLPHLKRGAMRDFFTIIEPIYNPAHHNKTDSIYMLGNSKIEFFPADDESKMKGARRDILFMNEANNISKSAFDQLEPRTKICTFIDFNPTHWFYAHDLQNDPGVSFIKTTYRDNDKLDKKIIQSIESRKDKDPNWWRVYGEGEIGMVEDLVFNNWQQVESFPDVKFWCGLDFGYTNDPSALVRIAAVGEDLFVDELVYRTGLMNPDIARLILANTPKYTEVYADSSEPKSIDEIYGFGVNIHPVKKGKDSILQGIDVLHRYNIKVTKQSVNLVKELRNYSWMKDKEGRILNRPIDLFNHGIDALRYAAMMKLSKEIDNTWVV